MMEEGVRLKKEVDAWLGDDGLLLFPSHAVVAPKHGASLYFPVRWSYTAILNVLELPVTQVPLGLSPEGLPLGVQLAAGHGQDELCLQVAMLMDDAFGGWVVPPL